jgi:hypothetical protein
MILVISALVIAAGCSSNKEKIDTSKQSVNQAAPMQEQAQGQMPPGHPPVQQQGAVTNPHPATDSANGLTWDVPSSFEKVAPASTMRVAQYRVPSGKEGAKDGELAVFFFGNGMGGAKQANLERWAGQFKQDDNSDPMSKAKVESFDAGALKVTTIEVTGHYVSSTMGGGPSYDEPGWKLYGAVVEGDGGPWFFKAVGPKDVIDKVQGDLSNLYHKLRPTAT